MRKDIFAEGHFYHVLNRSIAKFQIFNINENYRRFIETLLYYQHKDRPFKFSRFVKLSSAQKDKILLQRQDKEKLASIVCYCLMPTHFHLVLKQLKPDGISKLISDLENSYTKYFNLRHGRRGPLWESRFKGVLVNTDEQLLHLTRYIHLNPISANIVKKPEDWEFSSYREYLKKSTYGKGSCEFRDVIDSSPKEYQIFTEERAPYQKELSKIKRQLLENHSG